MSTTFTLPSASAALFSRTWQHHHDHNDDDDHDDDDHDEAHNDHDQDAQDDLDADYSDDTAHLCKLDLILLDQVPGHIAQLSILPNLVWGPDQ